MAWRWTSNSWTPKRLALAHAVYAATQRESRFAPMLAPMGSGNLLLRSFSRQHLGQGLPASIPMTQVQESIRVRDAALDQNRFSGQLPAFEHRPAVVPARGGLYCSEDIHAAIAELMHYSEPNLARHMISKPARLEVFAKRCFVGLRAVGELGVVSLQSDSPAMLPFLATLGRDPAVAKALAAARYKDLFEALYAAQDYAAARGLGLGLAANPEIDGVRLISARDYEADAGGQRVMRTGDNVLIFGLDQRIATHAVRVESLHLVDKVGTAGELEVIHYAAAAGGVFQMAKSTRFSP